MTTARLNLANRQEELTRLTGWIQRLAEEQGWDAEMVFNLDLVLEEAVLNVIKYAFEPGRQAEMELTCQAGPDEVRFVLSDEGRAFDPLAAPEKGAVLDLESAEVGGQGIRLIKNLLDGLTYDRRDGRNVLTMIKKVNKQA